MHNPVKKKSLYKYVNAIWYNSTIIKTNKTSVKFFYECKNSKYYIKY